MPAQDLRESGHSLSSELRVFLLTSLFSLPLLLPFFSLLLKINIIVQGDCKTSEVVFHMLFPEGISIADSKLSKTKQNQSCLVLS